MTKRPSLGSTVARSTEAIAAAAATARALTGAKPAPAANSETAIMTTSTIHMPAELLNALRTAALRRSMRRISGTLDDGKNTRPSVSEIVVEMLTRHRGELDTLE
jgi:hypothetical protein